MVLIFFKKHTQKIGLQQNAASAWHWLRRGDVSAKPRCGLRSALAMNGFNRLDENEGRATTLSSCPAEGRPLSLSAYWVTIKTVTQHSSQKRIHKRGRGDDKQLWNTSQGKMEAKSLPRKILEFHDRYDMEQFPIFTVLYRLVLGKDNMLRFNMYASKECFFTGFGLKFEFTSTKHMFYVSRS